MSWNKLFVLLFLAALLAFGSPNNAGTAANEGTGTTRLSILLYGYYNQNDSFGKLDMKGAYRKVKPGVELTIQTLFVFYEVEEFLKTCKAADTLPDVLQLPYDKISDYRDMLLPLDTLNAAKNSLTARNYACDGKILAIPDCLSAELVWYRKSVFKEYGLQVPRTWGQFVEAARKIKQGGKYTPIALGMNDGWSAYPFTEVLPSLEAGNGSLQNALINEQSPFSENKPYYNAFSRVKKLAGERMFSHDALKIGISEAIDQFSEKRAAMFFFGQWFRYGDLHRGDPSDTGAFFLPLREKENDPLKAAATPEKMVAVNKNSPDPNAASEFVDWYFGRDWYQPYVKVRQFIPDQKGIEANLDVFAQEAYDKAGASFTLLPFVRGNAEFDKIRRLAGFDANRICRDILSGKDPGVLLDSVNNAWKANHRPAQSGQTQNGASPGAASVVVKNSVSADTGFATIIHADYAHAYVYGVKTRMDASDPSLKALYVNGGVHVPLRFLEDAFGAKTTVSGSSIAIKYRRTSAELKTNSFDAKVDGRKVRLGASPKRINGKVYIPLKGVAESIFGQKAIYSGKLVILSEDAFPGDKTEEKAFIDSAGALFRDTGSIRVAIDPRIELLTVLHLLSGYGGGRITPYDSAYKTEVLTYFRKYENHPSVKYFTRANSSFGGDLPFSIVVNLSVPPGLSQQAAFGDSVLGRVRDGKALEEYITAMRSFAIDTDFMSFAEQTEKRTPP